MKLRPRTLTARRTRFSKSLWSLPEEVLILILKCLTAKELLRLRQVCSKLRLFIDSSPTLWSTVTFPGTWPSVKNMHIMERAASNGNIEALIKLGIAHLYNEGISEERNNSVNAVEIGGLAAKFFCQAESVSPNSSPFTWFFIRPPWSPSGTCCKASVYNSMVSLCAASQEADKSVLYCVGKILSLQEDEERLGEAAHWLQRAINLGSSHAAFELWKMRSALRPLEPSSRLQSLRELRECAMTSHMDAQYTLALEYAAGNLGGASKLQVAEFISQFLSRSKPLGSHRLFNFQTELNATMRYILVDWLVEVAVMKDFNSQIVHTAVHCVDQYLMSRKVHRSQLQLLGIACMLVAARFQGKDIVTIREAAWLTDNTYKYEDVVRMMGEVMSCIKGQVRVLTIPDYLVLFGNLAAVDRKSECIASYVGDLSILHTEFGRYPRAVLAASAVLVANLIQGTEFPWPSHLPLMTGMRVMDLFECALHLHNKCLVEETLIDHRNVKLKAVKERYAEERYQKVSELKIPGTDEIRSLLLQQVLLFDTDRGCFPTVNGSERHPVASAGQQTHSEEALMNTSVLSAISESGYEGDQEDEGETMDEDTEMEGFGDFGGLGEQGVFNRPSRNSSFLGDDEFSRSGSTPSILRSDFDDKDSYDVDVDEIMQIEPVRLDDVIDSASGYYVPVVLQPEGGSCDSQNRNNYRVPLRSIQNDPNRLHAQGLSSKHCHGNRTSDKWKSRGMLRGELLID